MAERIPIVYDGVGNLEQLQNNDTTPTQSELERLEYKFRLLLEVLYRQGIDLPRELTKDI